MRMFSRRTVMTFEIYSTVLSIFFEAWAVNIVFKFKYLFDYTFTASEAVYKI